ncbi:MAG: NapC/NirT family cytochrome c, partial [Candidatus Binatia bacterium]
MKGERLRPALQAISLGVAFGAAAGIGGYTFVYAKGYAYLTDDPGACANCHVMEEQHSAWMKSSHRAVAVCNDCHTPPG